MDIHSPPAGERSVFQHCVTGAKPATVSTLASHSESVHICYEFNTLACTLQHQLTSACISLHHLPSAGHLSKNNITAKYNPVEITQDLEYHEIYSEWCSICLCRLLGDTNSLAAARPTMRQSTAVSSWVSRWGRCVVSYTAALDMLRYLAFNTVLHLQDIAVLACLVTIDASARSTQSIWHKTRLRLQHIVPALGPHSHTRKAM